VTRLTCLTGSVTERHCWWPQATHRGTVETAEPCRLTDTQHHVSSFNNLFHCWVKQQVKLENAVMHVARQITLHQEYSSWVQMS